MFIFFYFSGFQYKNCIQETISPLKKQANLVQSNFMLNFDEDCSYDITQNSSVNDGPGLFPCTICGKVYRWHRNLQSHIRQECGKEPRLFCPHCPYRSKIKSNLKKHIQFKHFIPAHEIKL